MIAIQVEEEDSLVSMQTAHLTLVLDNLNSVWSSYWKKDDYFLDF